MSVPSRVVTNHELATVMETSNEWIIERTGIEERRWVVEGETGATDIASPHARRLIRDRHLLHQHDQEPRRRHPPHRVPASRGRAELKSGDCVA
jgi:hypothetical protein